MLYTKNIPNWERTLRVLLSFIAAYIGYLYLGSSVVGLIVIASALAFSVTGFVGWCPMCAMVGRKLDVENKKI